ncbi:TetR/AcrR family transcriptional regulator [Trujillonella endophytica]|uniref:Transcriptional regulator, TetR family n=1 Tax=Trujillonella endophytica TaxID=673521 RepID=A0A1H8SVQ9_9ACTN|nr:TetR/AcrR family transcriptional regulator [Trujillella endophytica]SEO82438.1 transcriptional regulator, TetR family [Trujillella endophytica]
MQDEPAGPATDADEATPAWITRAADRAPSVQNSRMRSMRRAQQIVDAARHLITTQGSDFTTHMLVKEAGIAVQTLYKHFAGKDQVVLAVLEDMIAETVQQLEVASAEIADPVERLRFYVTTILGSLGTQDSRVGRFITTEHWRLVALYPEEIGRATQPVADLFQRALREGEDAGLLHPSDAAYDAWLTNELIRTVFHHYQFASTGEPADVVAERVWRFCLGAWGGRP